MQGAMKRSQITLEVQEFRNYTHTQPLQELVKGSWKSGQEIVRMIDSTDRLTVYVKLATCVMKRDEKRMNFMNGKGGCWRNWIMKRQGTGRELERKEGSR